MTNERLYHEKIESLEDELDKYKKAYNILMEYFDSISDKEQPKVHQKLVDLGL